MELPTGIHGAATESLDQATYNGHAGIQAQLLEGNYVDERLEQIRKTRRAHATQRQDRAAQLVIDWRWKAQEYGIHIQPEYPPQVGNERGARLAAADAATNVRLIDGADILDLDDDGMPVNLEDAHVALTLPNVHEVRRPALQDPHCCLEMERRSRRQLNRAALESFRHDGYAG
jgi:hypothetical protein